MTRTGPERIAIVTDSTAAIPQSLLREDPEVIQVALSVVIGQESAFEHEAGVADQIRQAIEAGKTVSTSQPSPGQFLKAYQQAAEQGATGIVSVHISGELSGTLQSAHLAASQSPIPVQIVDSRSVGMGLGYAALAGARLAAQGANLEQVFTRVKKVAESARVVFFVDNLEHLRRGGRLTGAASAIGTVLGVRPLLEIRGGAITVVQKVRSRVAALQRLEQVIIDSAARRKKPAVTVHHFDDQEPLAELVQRLEEKVAGPVHTGPIGAVLGAHAGPGVVAFVVSDLEAGS